MLWLPKWLTTEEAPVEGVSRRTFLFLGAAAGASLLLPEPGPLWPDANLLMNRTFVIPVHVGRNWSVMAGDRVGRSIAHFTREGLPAPMWESSLPAAGRSNYHNLHVTAAEKADIDRHGWQSKVLQERLAVEYGLVRKT
jgi:hypothetical protein